MASIRITKPKQAEEAASRLTPRPQKKSLSVTSQPAPVPDIPNPLAELPAEGSKGRVRGETSWDEKRGLGTETKSLGLGDGRDSRGKSRGSRRGAPAGGLVAERETVPSEVFAISRSDYLVKYGRVLRRRRKDNRRKL